MTDTDNKIKLLQDTVDCMRDYKSGDTVEFSFLGIDWSKTSDPTWSIEDYYYRKYVEPQEEDYIDWSHVSPEYKFMARDYDGTVFLYTHVPPYHDTVSWRVNSGEYISAIAFKSLKIGNKHWKDSLVERPKS